MNILVATDFSKPADHAVDLAAALAHRFGDKLIVAFAQEPAMVASPDFAVDVTAMEQAVSEKAQHRLLILADELKKKGVTVETRLLRGAVVDSLVNLGTELQTRFIVAGTHARGPVGRLFLGSVAEHLVLQADRPVLVTRTDGYQGLLAWARSDRTLHVAIGLDFSATSRFGVDWVKALREVIPCDITFLNFYWPPEQLARLGISTEAALDVADPLTVQVITRELKAFVGEVPGTGRVQYKIESNWGEMGSHLAFAASDVDADVLVLGTHQRKGVKRLLLGSTLQPTLHAAIVPVLSVPGSPSVAPIAAIPKLSQVLVATDLSSFGNGAVPYAYSLVEKGGVVHLLHVAERHLPNAMFSFDPNIGIPSSAMAKGQAESALRGLVPPGAVEREIRTEVHVVEGGRIPTAILQVAERLGVDAVCVGSHGRGGLGKTLLGSVANVILEGSSKPVFVVRGARP